MNGPRMTLAATVTSYVNFLCYLWVCDGGIIDWAPDIPPLEMPVHHPLLLIVGPLAERANSRVKVRCESHHAAPRAFHADGTPMVFPPFDKCPCPVAVVRARHEAPPDFGVDVSP